MSNKHEFKNSSSLSHCDYDDNGNTLIVKFTSGATYHYPGCSKEHYTALKEAASAGSYFHKHIKTMKAVRVD